MSLVTFALSTALMVDIQSILSGFLPRTHSTLTSPQVRFLGNVALQHHPMEPLSQARLREEIAVASPRFGGNEKQDAHEFFLEYVNQLYNEFLAARAKWLKSMNSVAGMEDATSLATMVFDSEVRKQLVCVQCGHSHRVTERLRDF